ncbi:unnamed protein product, partial [Mesorhabditis belari]|uniref:Renin receptor n=1 Tax=Mesorhabditis belari TaxID=2138241 RepID=A0AAF3FL23_9BILA
MKWLIGVLLISGVSASTLQFAAVPRSIVLPQESSNLRTSDISTLNELLLGVSTKQVSSFLVKTQLFSPTKAVAVVQIQDIDILDIKGNKYSLDVDGYDFGALDSSLSVAFGADREYVTVNKDGASGSQLSAAISSASVDDSLVKTKSEPLRSELLQVYKLVAGLKAQGAKLTQSNSPDVFQVTISGLIKLVDSDERNQAILEIQKAVNTLSQAIVEAYGDQAVVEVVCDSSPIQIKNTAQAHRIVKRAADETGKSPVQVERERYNVTEFTGSDYPAMFAIFLGLGIILSVAVLYIAVGIWNMDPGRDSIIYRMTTTRMKKD